MHLAFVSPSDPNDPEAFSGIPFLVAAALRRALAERGGTISTVGPLAVGAPLRGRVARLKHRIKGQGYLRHHSQDGARAMGHQTTQALREIRPDAVLSLSSLPLVGLETDVPVALWADATFEVNLEYYADYSGLAAENVLAGLATEREGILRADLALYAYSLAADSAVGYFGADPANVHVVPWGANLSDPPSPEAVSEAIAARTSSAGPERARLLFLGKDWYRKGGDRAVRVAHEMNRLGVPTVLDVVGTQPPLAEGTEHVEVHGFLSKTDPEQHRRFRSFFLESHFLCMPVRAEDFGCVFAEAAAFGLPALTMRTGGMPTTIGEGGVLFEPGTSPRRIAEKAVALLRDRETYRAISVAARERYEQETNWDVAVRRVLDHLTSIA